MKPSVDPRTCALLVIDMQEYQVRENGSIARLLEKAVPGMLQYFIERVKKTIIPNIVKLLDFFRSHDLPVYFAKLASMRPDRKDFSKNYRDFNKLAEKIIDKLNIVIERRNLPYGMVSKEKFIGDISKEI